jgi:hypothetical protein
MKHIIPLPDTETLRTLFNYDPETGTLSWRSGRRTGQPCGYRAGEGRGHLRVKVGQTHYRVHRIIWVLYYGTDIPEGYLIDHIDRDPSNNRISNLRIASCSFNCINSSRSIAAKENMKNQKKNARDTTRSFRVTIKYPDGTSTSVNSLEKAGQILGVGANTILKASERGHFKFLRLEGVTVEVRETRAKTRTSIKKKQTKRTRVL